MSPDNYQVPLSASVLQNSSSSSVAAPWTPDRDEADGEDTEVGLATETGDPVQEATAAVEECCPAWLPASESMTAFMEARRSSGPFDGFLVSSESEGETAPETGGEH